MFFLVVSFSVMLLCFLFLFFVCFLFCVLFCYVVMFCFFVMFFVSSFVLFRFDEHMQICG